MNNLFKLTKSELRLMLAMAGIVLISNILVQHLVGNWLTWAAFTYPFAFLVTDITNRLLGVKSARKIIAYGFIMGLLCSLVGTQIMNPDGFPYVSPQIALASAAAFLLAQLLDVYVFSKISQVTWYKAPLFSTVVGSALDTCIFFTLAFSTALLFISPESDASWAREMVPILGFGIAAPLWVSLAVADYCVKLCVSLVSLFPFKYLTRQES